MTLLTMLAQTVLALSLVSGSLVPHAPRQASDASSGSASSDRSSTTSAARSTTSSDARSTTSSEASNTTSSDARSTTSSGARSTTSSGARSTTMSNGAAGSGSDSGVSAPTNVTYTIVPTDVVIPVYTTSVGTGTPNDLGWIPSGYPTPTSRISKDIAQGDRTATAPVASHTPAINFNGDYSDQALAKFWDDWVGPVQSPPITVVAEPPNPYPSPPTPPPLYPSWYVNGPGDSLSGYKFPQGFLFGWATAAQQWEGAVKADGKGPSIWDWASRFDGFIADNSTSDVTDLGYYLYKEDISRLAALGGNVYSFSVFWSRIFPFATADSPVNQQGLQFYHDLVDYCWSLGVEPVMTLFHWDTPLAVQLEYGGFADERIVDDFANYAETMFKSFNGKVKKWVTFNEPVVFCSQMGFPINTTLPEGLNSTTYPYTCSYHLTLAHATAVHRFRDLGIEGEIAFKSDNFLGVPWRANNSDDQQAQERHAAYQIGIFAEPIYNTGDWPDLIKNDLSPDILPRFNESQIEYIKCTADFFAIDGYRDGYVTVPDDGIDACRTNISHPNWPYCNIVNYYDSSPYGWGIGTFADNNAPWLQNTWQYVRPFLAGLLEKYPTSGGIYLSEFGFAEPYENEMPYLYLITTDSGRLNYFQSYLGEVLQGIVDDGIDIRGTFAWSLVDNFEWNSGLSSTAQALNEGSSSSTARFGCQYVDYNSPTLERTYKRSILEMGQFWNAHRCDNGSNN